MDHGVTIQPLVSTRALGFGVALLEVGKAVAISQLSNIVRLSGFAVFLGRDTTLVN